MNGESLAESQEGMSQKRLAFPKSDRDYEVANQLVEHSQGIRNESEGDVTDSADEVAIATPSGALSHKDGYGSSEKTNDRRDEIFEDTTSDGPYGPLSNPPISGQICRYASQ